MFVIVPIGTDRRQKHTPWITYTLIVINVVLFVLTDFGGAFYDPKFIVLLVDPGFPELDQFITYMFMHSWNKQGFAWFMPLHLLGNMLFLYTFGRTVEDALGKIGFLGFYLAGGVIAALGHSMVEESMIGGASGAVAAVTGAYLVLSPRSYVRIGVWIAIFVRTFEVMGMVVILFQIAQDAFRYIAEHGGVAYLAHLSGYAFGIVVCVFLLRIRLLARDPSDLLSLIEHRRRRAAFSRMTRRGDHPWESAPAPGAAGRVRQDQQAAVPNEQQQRILELRGRISQALTRSEHDVAATVYLQLLELDPNQTLSQQQQLDVANALMTQQRYESAARAYDMFLGTYYTYVQREQVQLILGLIYARYLDEPARAVSLLEAALPRLHDDEQKALAKDTLAQVKS